MIWVSRLSRARAHGGRQLYYEALRLNSFCAHHVNSREPADSLLGNVVAMRDEVAAQRFPAIEGLFLELHCR